MLALDDFPDGELPAPFQSKLTNIQRLRIPGLVPVVRQTVGAIRSRWRYWSSGTLSVCGPMWLSARNEFEGKPLCDDDQLVLHAVLSDVCMNMPLLRRCSIVFVKARHANVYFQVWPEDKDEEKSDA